MEKRLIDWEGIEREFRAGVRSLREIGAQFEVSHVGIKKKAEREGWERDLGAKIRAKADALVMKEAVTPLVTAESKLAEKQIVEANAAIQAQIRREHRTDIQRTKRIVNKLLEALEALPLPAIKAKATADECQKALDLIREHASAVKQLSSTQRDSVTMEREAFGIAQMVESSETPDGPPIDPIEGARRLAFALHRAGTLLQQKG